MSVAAILPNKIFEVKKGEEKKKREREFRSCVKVEVAVLGFPS